MRGSGEKGKERGAKRKKERERERQIHTDTKRNSTTELAFVALESVMTFTVLLRKKCSTNSKNVSASGGEPPQHSNLKALTYHFSKGEFFVRNSFFVCIRLFAKATFSLAFVLQQIGDFDGPTFPTPLLVTQVLPVE